MERNTIKQVLLDAVTPVTVTSSTDATPIVVTATAHGFANGDRVMIFGHATNIAANGIYKASAVTANTFALVDEFSGSSIAGSGAGAGSGGICLKAPQIAMVQDFRNIVVSIITAGTATTTIKTAISQGRAEADAHTGYKDLPNFGATPTKANPYSFSQIINLDDESLINGGTGVVIAGTDINKNYEVNTNIIKWMTVFPISWTAGSITVIMLATQNV